MFGIGLGLAFVRRVAETPPPEPAIFRIVPHGENQAFLIGPHPDFGAVALHLMNGNGADNTTPAASRGAPFGGWRLYGIRLLAAVEDDPTDPVEVISGEIGSQDYAINISNVFAGIYHGGFTSFTGSGPDFTEEGMIASGAFGHEAVIGWSGGQSATIEQATELEADGTITTVCTVACPHDTLAAYLDMTIANIGFTRMSLDGGASWSDVSAAAEYEADVDAVRLRNPSTGTIIVIADDSRDAPNFERKWLLSQATRRKLYADLDTVSSGHLGNVAVARTITIMAGEADPPPTFTPIIDTFDGTGAVPANWSRIITGGGTVSSSQSGGVWTVAAGASPTGPDRWGRLFGDVVKDGVKQYRVEIDYSSPGNNTASVAYIAKNPSAGTGAGNRIAFNGAATSMNLNSNSPTATASFVFAIPADAANPGLLLDTAIIAGRSIQIREVRVSEV